MSLSTVNRVQLELDGKLCTWQTASDIGSNITAGENGIHPKTGKTVRTPGVIEPRPLTLSKVYDPIDDKEFVGLLLDETPQAILRSGKTKASMIYYGEDGTIENQYILTGLKVSSFSIPGRDGLARSFGMLRVDFEVENIRQA